MLFEYEFIHHKKSLPYRAYFVNVGSINYHWHSDLELMWVLRGSVKLKSSKSEYILNEGDLYLVNPYEIHSLKNTNTENLLLGIQIDINVISHYLDIISKIQFNDQYMNKQTDLGKEIRCEMATLAIHINDTKPEHILISYSHLFTMLSKILSAMEYEIIDKSKLRIRQNDYERLNSIITYVNENYMNKISLEEIAKTQYISKFHLSRFIKAKLGICFQELINNVRLEHAIDEILGSNKKIVAVSAESGFSDIKYLNKLIKRDYGMTPSQLRKSYKEKTLENELKDKKGHRNFNPEEGFKIIRKEMQ